MDEDFHWIAERFDRTGLLNVKGRIIFPFEYDYIYFGLSGALYVLDTLLQKQYFTVRKNNRHWVFDRKTLQAVQPKILPESGLVLGNTFDQSNFSLLGPLSGDSLFVIEFPETERDLLNIKTGKRWGFRNVATFYLTLHEKTGEPLVYYQLSAGAWSPAFYRLNGQPDSTFHDGYKKPAIHTSAQAAKAYSISRNAPSDSLLPQNLSKRAKKFITKNEYELHQVEGIGWLALDRTRTICFLYSPDFRKKRPWNIDHSEIVWNPYIGLFAVYDRWAELIGYISQNGHLLFED